MAEPWCELRIARASEFTEHQAALERVLLPEERAHVHQVREGQATARLSRALLRLVLARHLDIAPSEVEIDRSCPECGRSHGRPRLRRQPGSDPRRVEFSVSHGGDLLVLALAEEAPIGVDVEPIGPADDLDPDLLDYALAATERRHLLELPEAMRPRVFLRYWTAKEAVLKALGTGLDVEPGLLALAPSVPDGRGWVSVPGASSVELWFSDVEVGPAHVCTLVTSRELRALRTAWLSPSVLDDPT